MSFHGLFCEISNTIVHCDKNVVEHLFKFIQNYQLRNFTHFDSLYACLF